MIQFILGLAFEEVGVHGLHQGSRVAAQQGLTHAPNIEPRIELLFTNHLTDLVSKLSRCVLYWALVVAISSNRRCQE